jgi:hypothetical protein
LFPVAGQKKSPKKSPQGNKKGERKSTVEGEDSSQVEPEEEEEPESKKGPAGKKSARSKAGKVKEPRSILSSFFSLSFRIALLSPFFSPSTLMQPLLPRGASSEEEGGRWEEGNLVLMFQDFRVGASRSC